MDHLLVQLRTFPGIGVRAFQIEASGVISILGRCLVSFDPVAIGNGRLAGRVDNNAAERAAGDQLATDTAFDTLMTGGPSSPMRGRVQVHVPSSFETIPNGYDANSRIDSIVDTRHNNTSNPRTRGFTYDAAGRLTHANSADPLHGDIAYTYDALGNLRTKTFQTGQWAGRTLELVYNGNNKLNWVHDRDSDGNHAWTNQRWVAHDPRGNVAHYGHLHAVHDMTNRPVEQFGRGTGTNGSDWVGFGSLGHTYDAHNRRVKSVRRNGHGTVLDVRYNIFDAAGTLVQVYEPGNGSDPETRTDYVGGPNGALARIKRESGTDTVTFIHADHLGTGRVGTAPNGTIRWEDWHTPFGESLIHPDATDDQGDYTGHIRDRKTGLTYMQARYYDPLIGRFLSIDPVTFMDTGEPGMFNRYAYTFNDPVNQTDPTGKCPPSVCGVQHLNNNSKASVGNQMMVAKAEGIGGGIALAGAGCALGGCAAAAPYVSTAFTTSNTTMLGMAGTSAAIAGASTAMSGGDVKQVATSATGAGLTTALAVKSGNAPQAALVFFGGGTTTAAVTDLIDGQKDSSDGSYLATGAINTLTGIAPVVPPTVSTAAGAYVDTKVQEVLQNKEPEDQ